MDKKIAHEDIDSILGSFQIDRKLPVADQVYDALKDAIITTRLLPGSAISEKNICDSIGVSRTPVRAALGRLSEEGLVDVFPQRGSFVSKISIKGITDDQFVRRTLEVAILREATLHWTPALTALARQAIQRQTDAIFNHDQKAFFEADSRLHEIFSIAGNLQGVWPTVMSLRTKVSRFDNLLGRPERLPIVIEEHKAILDALEGGNCELAEQRLLAHLNKGFNIVFSLPETYSPYFSNFPTNEG